MNEARHRELLEELRHAHEEAARLCKALEECELSDSDLATRNELLRAWTSASSRAAKISAQLRHFDSDADL